MKRRNEHKSGKSRYFRTSGPVQETARTILFGGGSGLDWLKARSEVINCFKASGCWEYVNPWPDLSDEEVIKQGTVLYDRAAEEPELNEVIFDLEEPNREEWVDQRLELYSKSIRAYEREKTREIEEYHREALEPIEGQEEITPAEARKVKLEVKRMILEMREAIRQKKDNELAKEESLIKGYDEAWKTWNMKFSTHTDKVKSAVKVFTEKLGRGPREIIKSHLDKGNFKRAWYHLDKYYLSDMAGGGAQTGVYNKLQNLVYNERYGLSSLLQNLEFLFAQSGSPDNETMKIHYLVQSIRNSSFKGFNQTLATLETMGTNTFAAYANALKARADSLNWASRNSSHNSSNEKANKASDGPNNKRSRDEGRNQKSNKKGRYNGNCDICGKKGHRTEDCWSSIKCEVCGQLGHPGWKCHRAHIMSDSQSSSRETVHSSSSNANETKSDRNKKVTTELTSMFKKKHPQNEKKSN
jgi:hypothetical protein